MKLLKRLRNLEKKLYPPHMRMMQEIKTWQDLQEYAESCQVKVFLTSSGKGYLILTPEEVIDMASQNPYDIFEFIRILRREYGRKPFRCDLRANTSGRLAKELAKKGKLKILHLSPWYWEEVEMWKTIIIIL